MRKSRWQLFLMAMVWLIGNAAVPAAAGEWDDFGRCLASHGATFYGASWCGHCRNQRQTLGPAMAYVRYVECAVPGAHDETTPDCRAAKVNSYPTWVFGDGSRAGGEQSVARLAARTGCPAPAGAEKAGTEKSGAPGNTGRAPKAPNSGRMKTIIVH